MPATVSRSSPFHFPYAVYVDQVHSDLFCPDGIVHQSVIAYHDRDHRSVLVKSSYPVRLNAILIRITRHAESDVNCASYWVGRVIARILIFRLERRQPRIDVEIVGGIAAPASDSRT